MLRPAPPVLAAVAVFSLTACRGEAAAPYGAEFVATDSGLVAQAHAVVLLPEGGADAATVRVLVNGYPVDEWGGIGLEFGGMYYAGVGSAFVGERNVVRVEFDPLVTVGAGGVAASRVWGEAVVTNDYAVEGRGWAERYVPVAGLVVARADLGAAWERWRAGLQAHLDSLGAAGALPAGTVAGAGAAGVDAVADSARAYVERRPVAVEMTFDSEPGPLTALAREVLREAAPVADRDSVVAFALAVRGAYAARDTAAVLGFEAFLDIGTPGEPGRTEADLRDFAADVLGPDYALDFGAGDLVLRPWAGGRVWEVRVRDTEAETVPGAPPPTRAFFSEPLGSGEWLEQVRLYVGRVGGELRRVRF